MTPKVPLTPEQQQEQESRWAIAEQTIKERAFLCYLLSRPAEMERFIGNAAFNEFFVEGRHCCIYECMEAAYLKHGAIDPVQYLAAAADGLIEREMYERVGGREYLADLACHVDFAPQFVWEFPTPEQHKACLAEQRKST